MSFTSTPIHLFLLLSYGKKPRLVKPLIIDYIPKYGLWGFGYQVLDIARIEEVVYRSGITASGFQALSVAETLLRVSRISSLPSYQSIRVVEVEERVSGIVPGIEYYQTLELARTLLETARLRAFVPSYQVTKLAEILEKISTILSTAPSYQVLALSSLTMRVAGIRYDPQSVQVLDIAAVTLERRVFEVTLDGWSQDASFIVITRDYNVEEDASFIDITRDYNVEEDASFIVITRDEYAVYTETTVTT